MKDVPDPVVNTVQLPNELGMEQMAEKIAILMDFYSREDVQKAIQSKIRMFELKALDKALDHSTETKVFAMAKSSLNSGLTLLYKSLVYDPNLGVNMQEFEFYKNLYFTKICFKSQKIINSYLTVLKICLQLKDCNSPIDNLIYDCEIDTQIDVAGILQSLRFSDVRQALLESAINGRNQKRNTNYGKIQSASQYFAESNLRLWNEAVSRFPKDQQKVYQQSLNKWKTSLILKNLADGLGVPVNESLIQDNTTPNPFEEFNLGEDLTIESILLQISSSKRDLEDLENITRSLFYFPPNELQEALESDNITAVQSEMIEMALVSQISLVLPNIQSYYNKFTGNDDELLKNVEEIFCFKLIDSKGAPNALGQFILSKMPTRLDLETQDQNLNILETSEYHILNFDDSYNQGLEVLYMTGLKTIIAKQKFILDAIESAGGVSEYLREVTLKQALGYGVHYGKGKFKESVIFHVGKKWDLAINMQTNQVVFLGDYN